MMPWIKARLAKGAPNVSVEGWLADVSSALCELDVLVLPSAHEGMPWVAMEAMAAGVTVLGSSIQAMRDLLEPDRGVVLSESSGREIASALEALASDAAQRARFGQAASRWVERECGLALELSRWRAVLE